MPIITWAGIGTDVGGGGGGVDEEYHPHRHPSDTPKIPADAPWEGLTTWCSSTEATLRDYKSYARMVSGNYARVRETLVTGLQIARDNYQRPGPEPMPFELLTLRSIHRALELNDVLFENGGEFENQVVSNLLSHFYNFIIDVNLNFDRTYTIPYFQHHHLCPDPSRHAPNCPYRPVSEDNFYAEFGKYALKLLSLALDRMEAMGSDKNELILFEAITGWAQVDLANSIFRRYYDCQRASLWDLNQIIHNFLNERKSYFPDSRMLILHTRQRVKEIKESLVNIEYGRRR